VTTLHASEVFSAPSQFNLEPAGAQPGRQMIDRHAERILVGGEQVHVFGGTVDLTPCSRMAPDPARTNPATPSSAIRVTSR
jgi:hypothetical protein